jgi:eukaryotic-like serine/threonine-protein kinase
VVTRKRPHDGATMRDVLKSAIESPPRVYPESVPRELADVCRRAMARDPADRFASVEALHQAIEAFLEHREAHAITIEGQRLVEKLRAAVERTGGLARGAPERDELVREIHRAHAEARFAFERALELSGEAPLAREGLRAAHALMLEHAIAAGDLPLAERILPDCDGEAARARVQALRARLGEKAREIEALYQNARRLDWSSIAPNLSSVFIASGVLGGLAALASSRILASGVPNAGWYLSAMWLGVAAVAGVYAIHKLRRSKVPDSLVSPRVVAIWAMVVLGCISNGISGRARGLAPFNDANYSATMIAFGFAAMALQTRLWLLAPAAAFFVGGIVMGYRPDWGVEVFGALWAISMIGVGVAFRFGATLLSDAKPAPPAAS